MHLVLHLHYEYYDQFIELVLYYLGAVDAIAI
jgi:hypothetical protein